MKSLENNNLSEISAGYDCATRLGMGVGILVAGALIGFATAGLGLGIAAIGYGIGWQAATEGNCT